MVGASRLSMAPRARARSDVTPAFAWPRAPGFRIKSGKTGGGQTGLLMTDVGRDWFHDRCRQGLVSNQPVRYGGIVLIHSNYDRFQTTSQV